MDSSQRRLLLNALVLGVAGAIAAQLFTLALHGAQWLFLHEIAGFPHAAAGAGVHPAAPRTSHRLWWIPICTALGGLVSGILVYALAPESEGHGTDTAVKAFHQQGGDIRRRVSPIKAVASAITIGSGGAAGREGPIALIAAGVGSTLGSFTARSPKEQRLMVLMGMAAGLSAIFRSPIGSAIFAVEVLYGTMEFEAGALVYTLLSSIVAYALNGFVDGWGPLFHAHPVGSVGIGAHGFYVILGLACGVVATALPELFYRVRDLFHAIPVPPHVKPAIGGLGVGVIAMAFPQVLGGGYGWIQQAMDGHLALELLATLLLLKAAAFPLTVSSGGSGGVFAPTLYIGAMLGGVLGHVFGLPPDRVVVVAMAATFAGAARVPMAALLMVAEMTGSYELLVPAATAVVLSTVLQANLASRLRLRYRSLYSAQVPTASDSPAHRAEHLHVALELLKSGRVPSPAEQVAASEHPDVDLLGLVQSGLPVALPGGAHMMIGRVPEGGRLDGASLKSGDLAEGLEAVAVMRGGEVRLPHGATVLHAGDRLLVVASGRMLDEIDDWVEPEGRPSERAR